MTTQEKWEPVDRILDAIDERRRNKKIPCVTLLDKYVYDNFRKGRTVKR